MAAFLNLLNCAIKLFLLTFPVYPNVLSIYNFIWIAIATLRDTVIVMHSLRSHTKSMSCNIYLDFTSQFPFVIWHLYSRALHTLHVIRNQTAQQAIIIISLRSTLNWYINVCSSVREIKKITRQERSSIKLKRSFAAKIPCKKLKSKAKII